MKIRKEHLQQAEKDKVLSEGNAEKLWENLSLQIAEEPSFKAQHVLYYFGAMLMLLPLSIFFSAMTNIGNAAILLISLIIGGITFYIAQRLVNVGRLVAAGVFATVSFSTVPLGLFSILAMTGLSLSDAARTYGNYSDFHQKISFSFVLLELLSLAASIAYLRYFKLPFLMLAPSLILWYLGMDLTSAIVGSDIGATYRGWSVLYGFLMLVFAYVVDKKTKHTLADFSFWLWIFGTISFWGGLSSMDSGSLWGKHFYALVNLAMIVLSVVVGRKVLAIAGAFGLIGYLGYLSLHLFKGVLLFPLFCLIIGAGVVWIGLKWPKVESWIAIKLGINQGKK